LTLPATGLKGGDVRVHSELLIAEFVLIVLAAFAVFAFVLRARAQRHITNGRCPEEKPITVPELWRSFWSQIWSDLLHGSPVILTACTGALTMFIGLHLLNPTIETFGAGSGYGSLNRTWFGETTWGVLLFAIGLGKLVLLAYHGVVRRGIYPVTYYLAALLHALMAIIWLNIAIGIVVSGGSGFGHATYFMLSLLSLWGATRRLRVARGGS
jgi:hypothetical protein